MTTIGFQQFQMMNNTEGMALTKEGQLVRLVASHGPDGSALSIHEFKVQDLRSPAAQSYGKPKGFKTSAR